MTPVADLSKTLDYTVVRNKSVLVTGGASGLGALIATSLAKNGARVTIADINRKLGEEFVETLGKQGLQLNYTSADVTDWQSQINAFKAAIAYSGCNAIDIVVAAAGVPGVSADAEPPSLEKDPPLPQSADRVFDVNAKGVYYTSQLARHYFALPSPDSEQGTRFRRCLVLVSSMAGYMELRAADYTACKWAVRGLFRSVRSKMEDQGFRINLIAPWVMDTPMSKNLAAICRKHGIPVGDANDVAKAVVRCAADDAICGRALAVGAAETFDLHDDLEGLNAGIQMKEYMGRYPGDFSKLWGQRI